MVIKIYTKELTRDKKPTHAILEIGNKNSIYFSFLESCLGESILDFKINAAARNPFNRGSLKRYQVFKIDNLSCFHNFK